MQDIRIAHDISRASRSDDDHLHFLRDQRLQKRPPRFAIRGGVFIGQVEYLDAMVAMQSRDLRRELHRIAMTPLPPEPMLSAVMAMMGTPARKLHDHGTALPVVGV